MESLGKQNSHIGIQISALVGMIRPDHRAFRHFAVVAPKARFRVVFQNGLREGAAIRERLATDPLVASRTADGHLLWSEGVCSNNAEDNQSFAVYVCDREGNQLVCQRFMADMDPNAELHSTLYAGDAATRLAIAERFLALLEKAVALEKAANARMITIADAIF